MARRIFKRVKRIKDKVIDKTSDVLSAPSRAKSRLAGKKADQLTEDIKVLREVKANARKRNSVVSFDYSAKALKDPFSLARRQMRVDDLKSETKKKKKTKTKRRLFKRR